MKDQPVIMLQTADPEWTWAALHSACTQARACGGRIALVHTLQVRRMSFLGSKVASSNFSDADALNLQAYSDTVADYGLSCTITLYQATNPIGAITEIAELVGASIVYAKPGPSMVPLWSSCEFELLRVRLSRQSCELLSGPALQSTQSQLVLNPHLKLKS